MTCLDVGKMFLANKSPTYLEVSLRPAVGDKPMRFGDLHNHVQAYAPHGRGGDYGFQKYRSTEGSNSSVLDSRGRAGGAAWHDLDVG